MGIEDRIRREIRSQVERISPRPDAWSAIERRVRERERSSMRDRFGVGIVAFALSAAAFGLLWWTFWAGVGQRTRITPGAQTPEISSVSVDGIPSALAVSPEGVWAAVQRAECQGALLLLPGDGGTPVRAIQIEGRVSDMAATTGVIWVEGVSCGAGAEPQDAVFRIEPSTGQVDVLPLGGTLADITASDSSVWVTGLNRNGEGEVIRIDPRNNSIAARISVSGDPRDVVVAGDDPWVLSILSDGRSTSLSGMALLHIDLVRNEVTATFDNALGVGVAAGRIWMPKWLTQHEPALVMIDPETDSAIGDPIPGRFDGFGGAHGTLGTLAGDSDGVWFRRPAASDAERLVEHIDAGTLTVDASVTLPDWGAVDAVFDEAGNTLWVIDGVHQSLTRVYFA